MNGSLRGRIISRFQKGFPLEGRPYRRIAEELGATEAEVLEALRALERGGELVRIGAVAAPGRAGCSTLAALRAEGTELERVAALLSALPELNHSYEREGWLNLWFVVHSETEAELQELLKRIAELSGCRVHDFRLVREFRIDLAFPMEGAVP